MRDSVVRTTRLGWLGIDSVVADDPPGGEKMGDSGGHGGAKIGEKWA